MPIGSESVTTWEALQEAGAAAAGELKHQTDKLKSEDAISPLDTDAEKNKDQQVNFQKAFEAAAAAGLPADLTIFKNTYYARLTDILTPARISEFFDIIAQTASLGFFSGPQLFEIFFKLLESKFGIEDLKYFQDILKALAEFDKKYPHLEIVDTGLALAMGDSFAIKQIPQIYLDLQSTGNFDDIAPISKVFTLLGSPTTQGFKEVSEYQRSKEKERIEKQKLEMTKGKFDMEMAKGRMEYNAGVLKNFRAFYQSQMNGPLGWILANWSRLLQLLSAAGSGAQTMENMLPGGTLSKKSSSDLKFVKIAAPATPPSFTSFMATPAGPTGTLPATVPATQAAGLAANQGAQSQISEAEKTLRPLETQHLKLSEQITQIHNRINSLLEYSYNSSISAQQFFTNMQVENADPQQILVEVGNYKNTIEFDLKVLNQLNTIYESIQNVASPDNKTIEVNTRAKLVQNQETIAKRQQELITANVYEVSLPIEIQIIQVKAERESAFMEKENARQSGGINMLPVYDNLINTYKTEMGLRSSVLSVYQSAPVTEPNTAKVFKGLADRTKRLIRALELEIKKFRREMSPGVYKNPFRQSEDNTKFVKLAKYEKIADEVIEDYYNDLYDNDPPYGTVLEHPSKFRKTPTYKIRLKK